jgi:predicted metal-dependent HD superfamily phosphohydrolase
MPLLARWQMLWRQLGASHADESLFRKLGECYAEPHRRYHTMQHLEECFAHLDNVRSFATRPSEVELALWFHDAIYDTSRTDNEARSAEWARVSVLLAGLSSEIAERVAVLVFSTKHDAVPVERDAQLLVDVDLAILGADPARFDEYEVQIREEYGWVPKSFYKKSRRKVLQQFLDRERIYSTDFFQAEYEAKARENISRSLARL